MVLRFDSIDAYGINISLITIKTSTATRTVILIFRNVALIFKCLRTRFIFSLSIHNIPLI